MPVYYAFVSNPQSIKKSTAGSVFGFQLGKVMRERSYGGVDSHCIVVQDNEHIGVGGACIVQSLESHTTHNRSITYHSYMLSLFIACQSRCHCHTQDSGKRGRRMSGAKSIVLTFCTFRKTTDTFSLAYMCKILVSTGEDFMSITLVPYVPYQHIVRSIEHIVQRNSKLYHSETCT